MCGIIGEISFNSILDDSWIKNGIEQIRHRGPDSHGFWSSEDKRVVFGHRRLSVIDLSDNGKQPMHSTCGNYSITFNGEIYNYKNLTKELKNNGLSFKTKSDTEVILNSYKFWGDDFLNKIEGMFAFAIFDKKKNLVILARDKSGEKPLYFFKSNSSLSFCSELKGLFCDLRIKRKLSKKNFIDFLRKGFVSGEKTLIEDVNKIKPGQYIKFNLSDGNLILKNFFNLPFYQNKNFKNIQINNLQNEFKNLLTKSVKNQIYADVPVGILLSGGVDSSLITALAAEENSKVNTYTFLNNINDKNDFELKNSRLISDYFSTNHLEIYYPDIKVTILDELMKFLDDPIIDSSLIPTYLITKEIKKYCTVALGGDGGDELFGGYDHYFRLLKLSKFNKLLPKRLREIISKKLIQYLPTGFRGKNWFNLMGKDLSNEYLDFAVYFDHLNYRHIINEKYLDKFNDLKKNNEQNFFCEDLIFKASQQDFHNFLVEDILVKTDRTSMANSLELRCPYLDKDIINFAFREIPSSLKVNAYNKKIFLKKLASKILPRNFELNKKRGFSIPIATFFENVKWRDIAKDILLEKNSLFNTRSVSNIIKKPFFNHNNSERIFGLLIFELWRKKYNVSL